MPNIWYAVTATLPDEPTAREFVHWLEDGHVEQVLRAGAHSAMIVRLEPDAGADLPPGARQVMAQYIFSTRELFDLYIRDHAPALRADGMARFGPNRGVRFDRRVGEIA